MGYHADRVTDHVIRRLAQLRVQRGLTIQAVADAAGITRPYLSFLEKGRRRPTLDVALRWAEALGISLSRLLAETERRKAKKQS